MNCPPCTGACNQGRTCPAHPARPIPAVTSMWMDELSRPWLHALLYAIAIVGTVVISLFLGGCGGGDAESESDAQTYTRTVPRELYDPPAMKPYQPAPDERKFPNTPNCTAEGVCT